MHIRAHLFQPLLVVHAKALFLIHDQQAQILEGHTLGQKRMGADHDIDRAIGHAALRLSGLFLADKARQLPHIDGKPPETIGEGLGVLARQKRGGRDHGHLLALGGGDKGRAHRHFGLAETHIAHDEAIHRAARLQIGQHIGNGGQLIIGFLIGKTGAERLPHVGGRNKDRRAAQFALGGDADQLIGDLAQPLFQLGLLGLPRAAAQPVQKPIILPIARQQFDILDRQEQPVAACIFQQKAFMRRAHRGDGLKPLVAAHTVINMHHQIAGAERLRLGQVVVGALDLALGPDQTITQHILL